MDFYSSMDGGVRAVAPGAACSTPHGDRRTTSADSGADTRGADATLKAHRKGPDSGVLRKSAHTKWSVQRKTAEQCNRGVPAGSPREWRLPWTWTTYLQKLSRGCCT